MGRYEVQILDSYGVTNLKFSDNGGIYERWEDGKGFEGHPPLVNASQPPGAWQRARVTFRAARFQDEQPTGPLMAQGDHGPVAFRNVKITPLHLP